MRRWTTTAVILALGVGGWWGRSAWLPSEADRIRHFMESLAAEVSFGPDDRGIATGRRITRLVNHFTPDASIQMEILGAGSFQLSGRGEIQQTLWGARRAAQLLSVRFYDIVVELAPGGESSTAHLTATAEARAADRGTRRNQELFEAVELRFGLRRVEGAWKVQWVETVPTLKQ